MGINWKEFGIGALGGFAESTNVMLKRALEKDDKELSRASAYFREIRETKRARKEAKDDLNEKIFRRLFSETGGDGRVALAVYDAVGKDPEKVKQFIDDVDKSRAAGIEYNILDQLNIDPKYDSSQLEKISIEQAVKARTDDLKPADVQVENVSGLPSFLARDLSKEASDSLNKLIPGSTREEVSGVPSVKLSRDKLLSALTVEQALKKNQINPEKEVGILAREIETGKDIRGTKLSEEEIKNKKSLMQSLYNVIDITERGKGNRKGMSLSQISQMYKDRSKEFTDKIRFKQDGEKFSFESKGRIFKAFGPNTPSFKEAVDELNRIRKQNLKEYIKDVILDEKGDYKNRAAQDFINGLGRKDLVTEIRQEIIGKAQDPIPAASNKDRSMGSVDPGDTFEEKDMTYSDKFKAYVSGITAGGGTFPDRFSKMSDQEIANELNNTFMRNNQGVLVPDRMMKLQINTILAAIRKRRQRIQ